MKLHNPINSIWRSIGVIAHSVEIAEIFSHLQNFREINVSITKSPYKLFSQNIIQVRVNILFFHTVWLLISCKKQNSFKKGVSMLE